MRATFRSAMRHLDRYTPEICSQLRQIAEHRQWRSWDRRDFGREELLEDLELTYHLHIAAEAIGRRAGMAPMPPFPIGFSDTEGCLDPSVFIKFYSPGRVSHREWNQSDNAPRTEMFNNLPRTLNGCMADY